MVVVRSSYLTLPVLVNMGVKKKIGNTFRVECNPIQGQLKLELSQHKIWNVSQMFCISHSLTLDHIILCIVLFVFRVSEFVLMNDYYTAAK